LPVVPAAIIGAYEAHPRGSNWPKRGRLPVGVVFGDPLTALPGESASEFTERIRSTVVKLLEENSDRVLGSHADSSDAPTAEGDRS
jgi:1-acyl-sn-glycerol-3-phosphate acyltransferase